MNIFNLHNVQAHPGGMEVVFTGVSKIFRDAGHTVTELSRDNTELGSTFKKMAALGASIYSPSVYKEISALIKQHQPRVAHVHNIYPQFSTSALDAFHDAGVPVLMHVGDYKLTCPTAQHLRHGTICEKCIGGREYFAAIHNCRNSRTMSTAYAVRNAWARLSGKLQRGVSLYVCPTQFVADLIIRGGYPKDRVRVVSNFCDLPDAPPRETPGDYVGYIGRISPEKGIDVLIDAARRTGLPTRIVGDASFMPEITQNIPDNVQFVGKLDRAALQTFLDGLRVLVVPSAWYEAFGLVCVEALSRGIPVIASDVGGLSEVVWHEQTGLLVPMRDPVALAGAMQRLWNDPAYAKALGHRGYHVVRERFTPGEFYKSIYTLWNEVGATQTSNNISAA